MLHIFFVCVSTDPGGEWSIGEHAGTGIAMEIERLLPRTKTYTSTASWCCYKRGSGRIGTTWLRW